MVNLENPSNSDGYGVKDSLYIPNGGGVHNICTHESVTSPDACDPLVEWQLRCDLAAVYRLVDHFGLADLIFTHISLRVPSNPGEGDHFLINPYGLMFDEITASALVKIDISGQPVTDSPYPVNPAGFVIHSAIHAAREDARCVVHLHSRYACAVAAQRDGLLPLHQISMEFYQRIGYHDYEGVALNFDEQQRLVHDLGSHHSMIMRNHGLLTVGKTPWQAFIRAYYLEKACQIQIDATAGGRPLTIPDANIIEHTARQLNCEPTSDDFVDTIAAETLPLALSRLVKRKYPDFAQ